MAYNIIFLDIDGVLATRKTRYSKTRLDEEAIENLKRIIKETNAHIVISSTWRYGNGMEDVIKVFAFHGIPEERIIGHTPRMDKKHGAIFLSPSRGAEISEWFKKTTLRIGRYVVIDDDSDISPHEKKHVKPVTAEGLNKENAEQAIRILKGQNALKLVGLK